jgi:excisionase family DNA binding protein
VVKSQESLAWAIASLTELPESVADLRREVAYLLAAMARVENRLPSPLANVQQAAAALRCSVPTIRRKVKAGEIPSMRIGRSVRIDLSKLRALTGAEVRDLARRARGE